MAKSCLLHLSFGLGSIAFVCCNVIAMQYCCKSELERNKKEINKKSKFLASGMFFLHCDHVSLVLCDQIVNSLKLLYHYDLNVQNYLLT